MSKGKYIQCAWENATHIECNGVINNIQVEKDKSAFFVLGRWFHFNDGRKFGMNPMRLEKQGPVEFTASFYRGPGGIWTHVTDPRTIPDESEVLKFRCVQMEGDKVCSDDSISLHDSYTDWIDLRVPPMRCLFEVNLMARELLDNDLLYTEEVTECP